MKHTDYEYLKDQMFINNIHLLRIQKQHIKITCLNWEEEPIQEIQGIVSAGSLNLSGKSTIRRNGNITVNLNKDDDNLRYQDLNTLFAINKKIYIEIGIENTTNEYSQYPIIWFPQGIFIIHSPSIQYNKNGIVIQLNLKDKMSLLNGEIAGTLPASITFQEYDDGKEVAKKKTPIYSIIQELVNHHGGEDLNRIFIDFPHKVRQVLKWTGEAPIYLLQHFDAVQQKNIYELSMTEPQSGIYYTITTGMPIGYTYKDFYFPKDLISNYGDSICSVLDKLKQTFTNYEYYYDIDGNFIFQEIKNYLLTSNVPDNMDELDITDYLYPKNYSKSVKTLDDSNIVSLTGVPQYQMIKNDFTIWGERPKVQGGDTSSKESKLQIRYRLVIDKKPLPGNIYNCFVYTGDTDYITSAPIYALRIPIPFETYEDFPETGEDGIFYYSKNDKKIYQWKEDTDTKTYHYDIYPAEMIRFKTTDWRTELYLNDMENAATSNVSAYYADLQAEWPKLYNFKEMIPQTDSEGTYYISDFYQNLDYTTLNYFLDFIDDAELSTFSVSNIGRRPFVKKVNTVNCIFEPKVPEAYFLFSEPENMEDLKKYYIQQDIQYITPTEEIRSKLYQYQAFSAFEETKVWLYQQSSYNETLNLTIVPLYNLEPNTRISLQTTIGQLSGDYIIDTITVPFDLKGAMSITARRALERF